MHPKTENEKWNCITMGWYYCFARTNFRVHVCHLCSFGLGIIDSVCASVVAQWCRAAYIAPHSGAKPMTNCKINRSIDRGQVRTGKKKSNLWNHGACGKAYYNNKQKKNAIRCCHLQLSPSVELGTRELLVMKWNFMKHSFKTIQFLFTFFSSGNFKHCITKKCARQKIWGINFNECDGCTHPVIQWHSAEKSVFSSFETGFSIFCSIKQRFRSDECAEWND